MQHSVVITGLGVFSPIGIGKQAFWDSLVQRRSGVKPITQFDPAGLPVRFAGEVRNFEPKQYVKPRKSLKVMARDIQLAVSAAGMAYEDAGLDENSHDPERLGVLFGTNLLQDANVDLAPIYDGAISEGKFDFDQWAASAERNGYPLMMLKYLPNMAACHVAISLQAYGPNNTITMDAASSLLAVLEATQVIQRGMADLMIVGGASTQVYPLKLLQSVLGRSVSHRNDLPEEACRPFDADRDGMVLSEGAAAFVLERQDHAEARGAVPLARILGGGRAFSGESDSEAMTRAIQLALSDAKRSPEEIGHINADGLSTQEEDRQEAEVIHQIFAQTPVTAPKSFFGSAGGASGALEMFASVLGIQHGEVPITLNYNTPDSACPVNVVHEAPLTGRAAQSALLLNRTLFGQAAALVIDRPL